MKTRDIYSLLNPNRLSTHFRFFIASLLIVVSGVLIKGDLKFGENELSTFILVFSQLEVFVIIAYKIFDGLKIESTRRQEFTRIVLSRFMLFYIACFVSAMIIFLLFLYAKYWLSGWDLSKVINDFLFTEFRGWFRSTIIGLSFGAVIFVFFQWQDALKREQKLNEENLIFQNETLKNQVNPHFLFNSLNTLSSLIGTQTEIAENFINRLSSIYRYILENISKDRVPLKSELKFITDYFSLHKIRDADKIQLDMNIKNACTYQILPVSLQSLIENSIKHNMATREKPLKISICIEEQYIIVKNNLQELATHLKSTKTGLKNLGERIRLITGKELIIEKSPEEFIVKVPLIK